MDRYLCIHGHFYQPPRENPWLEAVELQESAYPYHDWNERITDECYAANAKSRILDGQGRIERISSNYAHMSYNFGPTLLSWLEENRPEVHSAIVEADRESAGRFGGHGSAMAQGYNHMILPLASPRDRATQVRWGIRDFERRFGRKPEGMWLPETAANTDALEALAAEGIRFTVLAPRQAARSRRIGEENWTEANGGIDPSRAYLCNLPSGKSIALFFYDGPVSQAVAFEHLLESGEKFADRLTSAFDDGRDWPQLVHIATDGETYGHHHRHGDMALAYALEHVERNNLARLTNYAQYLELNPPTYEAQIVENSSWSCIHGVERWRSNCGCNSGREGWHQEWRAPLRAALDWLRDAAAPLFEHAGKELLKDPWAARDDYIGVILDRSPRNVDAFLSRHERHPLSGEEQARALRLLEMQRQLMLMYTSCGWFFDELSGIETVQVTQYAGRAIQLARDAAGKDLGPEFEALLERAPSNLAERPNGRRIYEEFVKPSVVDPSKLAAHYAIRSLFAPYGERSRVYAADAERIDQQVATAGRARLLIGRARFTSRVTRASGDFTYGVLHLGDHILNAGVREFQGDEAYRAVVEATRAPFNAADYPAVIRAMDAAFGASTYTLRSLFKDDRQRVMDRILEHTVDEADRAYRQVYENHAPLLRFLSGIGVPPPRALRVTAEIVLNARLRRAIQPEMFDAAKAGAVLKEAADGGIGLDWPTAAYSLQRLFESLSRRLLSDPDDLDTVRALDAAADLVPGIKAEVRLDAAQNAVYPLLASRSGAGGERAPWDALLIDLARKLRLRVD